MCKYLYAASVQGIQSFIFQTNRLTEIVGASELVEEICTKAFRDLLDKSYDENNLVIAAAGKVQYIFDSREDCEKAVAEFPRKVMKMAPGITISQAVVKYDDKDDFSRKIDEVEKRLRAQRNRIQPPLTSGLLGMRRAPGTGLPATGKDFSKDFKHEGRFEFIDEATNRKQWKDKPLTLCEKSFYGRWKYRVDGSHRPLEDRVLRQVDRIPWLNDWIAVIHADGNSLGQVVQDIGNNKENYKKFSLALDNATIRSANDAFKLFSPQEQADPGDSSSDMEFRPTWIDDGQNEIPLRPIVLGGDDMTVIIRGDLAIPYLERYMHSFEEHTGKVDNGEKGEMADILGAEMDHLTVCAGVAFIKSSFPFYYGYSLAESLCGAAKKHAREWKNKNKLKEIPSCLMFHKVQDSFVESYDDIAKRELIAADGKSFRFGPYYLKEENKPEGFSTISELLNTCRTLCVKEGEEDIRPAIRKWLGFLHESSEKAHQWLRRVKEVHPGKSSLIDKLTDFTGHGNACMAYDALALSTIMSQVTKEDRHDSRD